MYKVLKTTFLQDSYKAIEYHHWNEIPREFIPNHRLSSSFNVLSYYFLTCNINYTLIPFSWFRIDLSVAVSPSPPRISTDFKKELIDDRTKWINTVLEGELHFACASVCTPTVHISQHFFVCFCLDNNSISNRCFCCYCSSSSSSEKKIIFYVLKSAYFSRLRKYSLSLTPKNIK